MPFSALKKEKRRRMCAARARIYASLPSFLPFVSPRGDHFGILYDICTRPRTNERTNERMYERERPSVIQRGHGRGRLLRRSIHTSCARSETLNLKTFMAEAGRAVGLHCIFVRNRLGVQAINSLSLRVWKNRTYSYDLPSSVLRYKGPFP